MAVIEARAVSKQFLLKHNASVELKVRFLSLLHPERRQSIEEFWALKDVSLLIERGEAVGLVGRNGSGKSTFLKLIAAIHRPTSGRLLVARGARVSSMIELGVGFHPELTGRENVFLNAAINGLTKVEIEGIYPSVVRYSGLEHFIDVPIKNYSSGMYMRLGFSIAANLNPDIILLDEIFAVGDANFQQQCISTLKRFMESGKTIVFVSHSPEATRLICRRLCVLDQGRLTFDGALEKGLSFYERQIESEQSGSSVATAATVVVPGALAEAELNLTPHRIAAGSHWRETGHWQFDLLRREGLEPHDYVLDVGCGSLMTAVHLLPFLDRDRYVGVDHRADMLAAGLDIELPRHGVDPARGHFLIDETFDLSQVRMGHFDYAVATSVFPFLSFNLVARCIASVIRKLKPSGRFYASWFENPDPASFDPIVRPGVTTYQDREPFHYTFSLIAEVCHSLGATVERLSEAPSPRGESVLCIRLMPI